MSSAGFWSVWNSLNWNRQNKISANTADTRDTSTCYPKALQQSHRESNDWSSGELASDGRMLTHSALHIHSLEVNLNPTPTRFPQVATYQHNKCAILQDLHNLMTTFPS